MRSRCVVSISGIAAGLLLAVGGIAFGGFTLGSLAFGVVATGVVPRSVLDVSAETMQWLSLGAWALLTTIATAAVTGFIFWLKDTAARDAEE